jgi:hypothetical protein
VGCLRRASWPIVAGLILLAVSSGSRAGASAAAAWSDEIAPHLPAGARVVQVAQGETDGDGRLDTVALYIQPAPYGTSEQAGILVLRGGATTPTVRYLFRPPPDGFDAPWVEVGDRATLVVRDVNADGLDEIVLSVGRYGRRVPDEGLRVFRWDGADYRLEAMLEGRSVRISDVDGSLRVGTEEPVWHLDEGGPTVSTGERYEWRSGGYRLSEREVRLTEQAPAPTRPEIA